MSLRDLFGRGEKSRTVEKLLRLLEIAERTPGMLIALVQVRERELREHVDAEAVGIAAGGDGRQRFFEELARGAGTSGQALDHARGEEGVGG